MKTILVTAIGSFASGVVIRGLKNDGYRVIGTNIYPEGWIAEALLVDRFYQVPKDVDEELFLQSVSSICRDEGVDAIIPLTDVEIDFFQKHRNAFEKNGIQVLMSAEETIALCRDKWKMYQFIQSHCPSINPIPSIPAVEVDEAAQVDPAALTFPVVCKPVDGRSSSGLYRVMDRADWDHFTAKESLDHYIVQPAIPGSVIATDVVRDTFGNVAVVAREEVLRTLNGAGTTVRVFYDPELTKQCEELAEAIGSMGDVCFEFILDEDGIYHFLECNARFGGGSAFTTLAGYDCVENHLRAFRHEPIEPCTVQSEMIIARRYEEFITVGGES